MGNVDCFEIVGVNSFYLVGHYTTVLEFAILGGCFSKSNLGELSISFRFTVVIKSNVSNYEEYAELVGQKTCFHYGLGSTYLPQQ